MPKTNLHQLKPSNLQDNYSTQLTNLPEEPYMYEPTSNRRPGVTRRYEHNNKKHYVNIQYDELMLPRVVKIFSDTKQGTEYPDICHELSMNITERLQTRKNPTRALKVMAAAAPRRSDGYPCTIQGLVVDELIKSYYLED